MEQEGNTTLRAATVESLRVILEREQTRTVVFEEALDIGESLITFYEMLATDPEVSHD